MALEVHQRRRFDGRAWHAHLPSLRELRVRLRVLVVTSSESSSMALLSRCPRTVLKAQLLLFATCTGEANALRKSRLRDELLLVKAQLRCFRDGRRTPARRPRRRGPVGSGGAGRRRTRTVVGVFDGLPQRGILLVHGVRARRGGVAREGEGAQFVRTHKSVARTASSAAQSIALHATEKGSVCSWHIFHLEENGSSGVGFKLRLARSTVLGSRRPGPPAPAGQARGGLRVTAHDRSSDS